MNVVVHRSPLEYSPSSAVIQVERVVLIRLAELDMIDSLDDATLFARLNDLQR
jgi:hypothetical protein